MNFLRRIVAGAVIALTPMLASAQSPARAESFPNRPVTWIVPYAAGGGSDIVARAVAAQMSQILGQSVVIENRPGASTTIGASAVARASADGYTVGTADVATLALNRHLMPRLPYAPLTDFTFIGGVANLPYLLVVNPALPVNSIGELLTLARKEPGKLAYGTSGPGGGAHVAMELLQQRTGTRFLFAPYKGAAPAMQDLMAGHIQFALIDTGSAMQHIRSGKVRVIAVSMPERLASLPQVPTFAEAGVANFVAYSWQGLIAPKSVPEPVVSRLGEALARALASDKVQKTLDTVGVEPAPASSEKFEALVRQQDALWGGVIRDANIKLE